MTILFVAPLYEEKGERPKGGVSMYLRRVAGALKRLGHTPVILSFGTKNAHYVENGIEVFFVYCTHIHFKVESLGAICNVMHKNIAINRKISELIRERPIDIIQFASIWGTAVCYYGKVPAVMRLSIYTKVYRDYRENKLEIDMLAFMERLAAQRCNAVFAPSNVIATAFSEVIHRKVSVIESPFWNDSEVCDESVYNKTLKGKKYFLFFGRLVEDKGIFVLAKCLHSFFQLHPDYYFVCCGIGATANGEDPVQVLKRAAGEHRERFLHMKPLPHSSLYPIIQHADFVVFPSLIDNFSNACIESMYFGRVVIGTDGTSYEQLIVDGKSGFLCEPGNEDSLLEAMNKAASMDQTQKDLMGQYAKERISKLSPQFAVRKLLRYYQYVIDNVNK